jgi:hypothetical protein
MTMDDSTMRTILRDIAETGEPPEPAPRIDINRACRRGRRRLWARRVAPLAAGAVAAALLTVPHALTGLAAPGQASLNQQPPAASAASPSALTAPAEFNPLVPYATFGWLPAGFSTSAGVAADGQFSAGQDVVSLDAVAPASGGRDLSLTVAARDACPATVTSLWQAAKKQKMVTCPITGFVTGAAPDIDGRPAFWIDDGWLAWQYAPGAWATLRSLGDSGTGGTGSAMSSAMSSAISPAMSSAPSAAASAAAKIYAEEIRRGKVSPPSSATRALLVQVASRVRYDQQQAIKFPFALTGPLPPGWHVNSATYAISRGQLLGTGLSAGPAADPSALGIAVEYSPSLKPDVPPATWSGMQSSVGSAVSCASGGGSSSTVVERGQRLSYNVVMLPGEYQQSLCPTIPVDGMRVAVGVDMTSVSAKKVIPGSVALGGAMGVYARLRVLGANTVKWTTSPLG